MPNPGLHLDKINTQYIKRIMIFACFAYSNQRKDNTGFYVNSVSKFIDKHLKFYPVSYKIKYGPDDANLEEKRDMIIDELVADNGSDDYNSITIYFQYPRGSGIIEFTVDLRDENKYLDFLYL